MQTLVYAIESLELEIKKLKIHQRGATLTISLLLILVITSLILSSMQGSLLEEKISRNFRDYMIAFQAAETGLREAEQWLEQQQNKPVATNIAGSEVWSKDTPDTIPNNGVPWWIDNNFNWWSQNARISTKILTPPPIQAAKYIIEAFQFVPDTINISATENASGYQFYRITVLATGGSKSAQVKLQTTYIKRFDDILAMPVGRQSWQQL